MVLDSGKRNRLSNTEEIVTTDAPKVSVKAAEVVEHTQPPIDDIDPISDSSQCAVMEEVVYTMLQKDVHDQISKEYQNVKIEDKYLVRKDVIKCDEGCDKTLPKTVQTEKSQEIITSENNNEGWE